MTAKQMVKKWQKKLRIRDWTITVKRTDFGPHGEQMKQTGALADISFTFMTATLYVKKGLRGRELEVTVVHELLHAMLGTNSHKQESEVERIAQALVKEVK